MKSPKISAKYLLLIFSMPIDHRTKRALYDWRAVKDLVRGLLGGDSQPENAKIFQGDERIAGCEVNTSRDAHRAFCIVNGYSWNGTILGCIVQYPNGRWLVHHSTDPANAPPLALLYRASPGQWSLLSSPQAYTPPSAYDQRHRTLSVSSVSSSSGGSVASPTPRSFGTQGMPDYHPDCRNCIQLHMARGFIDAATGDLVPSNVMAGNETDLRPSHWHSVMHINSPMPYQYEASTHVFDQPRYDIMIQQRTIIIRELSRTTDQARLEDFLGSLNLRGRIQLEPDERNPDGYTLERRRCHAFVEFATSPEAVEAVQRLNGRHLAERRLDVEMAREATIIHRGSRERADSLASDPSTASSSVARTPSSGRRCRGPIIADGSV